MRKLPECVAIVNIIDKYIEKKKPVWLMSVPHFDCSHYTLEIISASITGLTNMRHSVTYLNNC